MKKVQNYAEYRIKEVNGIRQFENEEPVLGDLIKHVKITAATAKILNANAPSFGKVYVEVKPEAKPEKVELETEKLQENSLEKLREQAKELGVKGAHLMKEEKLIEKIKEAVK